MDKIGVVVTGASGKMGQEVVKAIQSDPLLELVGAVDSVYADGFTGEPTQVALASIPVASTLEGLLTRCAPQVLVDFTNAEGAMTYLPAALKRGIACVTGSTGLSEADVCQIEHLCSSNQVGAIVASNFALGAILMIHLSKLASRFFDYAEIIEMHHEQKVDAPSGTALATARAMVQARSQSFMRNQTTKTTLDGTRGGEWDGVTIHSVRLPGLVASQEVIFGSLGQTLTVRHDTISRESFMPGVLLAIREVTKLKGIVHGLDALLGLG
ncbi:MAG: 4-hydroxy-tetrahydrodipicolinate reductase [Dehalococcoidia bacterium]|nr:4-hydroxy-tetrahydrodipicolinate reductase [Dehalococcoidia bacterium]